MDSKVHSAGLCNHTPPASDLPMQHPWQKYPRPTPEEFLCPGQQQIFKNYQVPFYLSEGPIGFKEEYNKMAGHLPLHSWGPHLAAKR